MASAVGEQERASERLVGLLKYIKEVGRLAIKDRRPRLQLEETKLKRGGSSDGLVICEATFRKLEGLTCARTGRKLCEIGGDGAWLRLRRPLEGDGSSESLARAAYSELFAARQEGHKLVVGVGLVKWRDRLVDHPAIEMPASLELDPVDGSLAVRRAEASTATVWGFPGVAEAAGAVSELEKSAKDYGVLRTTPPTDRDSWAPILRRAAHCLGPDGEYFDGCPQRQRAGAGAGSPKIYNCFVLFCREAEDGDSETAKDADAMISQLRAKRERLPPALSRLSGPDPDTGNYASCANEKPELSSSSWMPTSWFSPSVIRKGDELFFGLSANEQQISAARILEDKGFCVVVGPPGTGKSQTIANIICHYVATGRRVLVTSKGEPATEVLRNKLPEGIRELCVSLGGGDTASYRRLEFAVERLADEVAAAPKAKLASDVSRLRQRLDDIDRDLAEVDSRDATRAAKFFVSDKRDPISSLVGLHPGHVKLLGLSETATASQLAAAALSSLKKKSPKPFLADVTIDPMVAPPEPALVDELRTLRRECGDAVTHERELKSRAARSPLVERLQPADVRELAVSLRDKAAVEEKVRLALLPRITDPKSARVLAESSLASLSAAIAALERNSCAPLRAKWLLSLVRRADDLRVTERIRNAAWIVDRLGDLGPRGLEGVRVPDVVLRAVVSKRKLVVPKGACDHVALAEVVLSDSDFVDEVASRAFPDRPTTLFSSRWRRKWFFGKPLSHTLRAELDEVNIIGAAKPSTPVEWRSVLRRLVLRGCASRLRYELESIARHDEEVDGSSLCDCPLLEGVSVDDDLALVERARQLATPLRLCCDALDAARGVTDLAARCLAAPSPLESASRGSAALDDELTRIRDALRAFDDDIVSAEADRTEILRQLMDDRRERVNRSSRGSSPLGELRDATENLGQAGVDSCVTRWLAARSRVREGRTRLAKLSALRIAARKGLGRLAPSWAALVVESPAAADGTEDAALPRDACRQWAAVAALSALETNSRDQAQTSSSCFQEGEGDDDSRRYHTTPRQLVAQREVVMRELVCAIAKSALRSSMSPETCAALVRLVSAVSAASGVSENSVRASRLKSDLAAAMADCSAAVPVWIMPTYRVAQCLPATLGDFDLVVLDEASQSDASALPTLLRGKQLLIVGDAKQVSPTAAFTSEADVAELRNRLASTGHRYREQLLPGRSIFDLANTCFADARVALVHHFRCVPQCISFSNANFYHSRLQPRRLPPASTKRLDPAVIDVRVAGGRKKGKVNQNEAVAIVEYLVAQLDPAKGDLGSRGCSVAVISLLGVEQARLIRRLALDALSDAQLAHHRIVFGDPATFQGDERDCVLLSMVASPRESPPQVGRIHDQRVNVAMSRARDRIVLFRSLDRSDIPNPDDVKHRLIAFFKNGGTPGPQQQLLRPTRGGDDDDEDLGSSPTHDLIAFLESKGFKYDVASFFAGADLIVEDRAEDFRICICIDGKSPNDSLEEWAAHIKEQRGLERFGWRFIRIWQSAWLTNREKCFNKILSACKIAGIRPLLTSADQLGEIESPDETRPSKKSKSQHHHNCIPSAVSSSSDDHNNKRRAEEGTADVISNKRVRRSRRVVEEDDEGDEAASFSMDESADNVLLRPQQQ